MFVSDIKSDFDKLKGEKTLADIGLATGIAPHDVYMAFRRAHVVAGIIVRIFDALGYDIALTYIPKGASSGKMNTSAIRPSGITYQVRRGNVQLQSIVPPTKDNIVSCAGMMSAVESEGHDLSDLDLVSEFDNKVKAVTFYQTTKKTLESKNIKGHDFADVLTLIRIGTDGVATVMNKWAGKLRRSTRGLGRPKKEAAAISLDDALRVLADRES